MGAFPRSEDLNEEQLAALDKAAYLIITARKEAAAMLARSGMDPPEQGWFGSPCHATLDFPPHPPCGCRDYTGDGGPCRTRILAADTGPDPLHPMVPCGHLPWQHLPT